MQVGGLAIVRIDKMISQMPRELQRSRSFIKHDILGKDCWICKPGGDILISDPCPLSMHTYTIDTLSIHMWLICYKV